MLAAAALLQGCQLPRNAPVLREVEKSGAAARIELIPATPELVAQSREPAKASFPPALLAVPPVDYERIAPGDTVDIAIWERDGLQMFSTGAGGGSDLGAFTVSRDGDVGLPYIDTLHIAGLTTAEARVLLLKKMHGLVTAADARMAVTARGGLVTVHGDVTKAGVFPIGPGFLRLGDALALVAPDQTAPEETLVTLRRGVLAATVRLSDIYGDPAQNIALRPDDQIVVTSVQTFVNVMGAATGQGHVRIIRRNYSVLDAVSDARGMADALSDPRALFLLRARTGADGSPSAVRPLVYQFDIRKPEQILLARQFTLKDGDIVFVSDAPYVQVQKVLEAFSATLGSVRSLSSLSQ